MDNTGTVLSIPSISIIVVVMNNYYDLQRLMPSLVTANGNFEIIIADNGSTDNSTQYIKNNYPLVRIFEYGVNLGFAEANNRAVQQARGETIVFLNPDTVIEQDTILQLCQPLRNKEIGLTTSKIALLKEPNLLNVCGNQIHISGISQCRGYRSSVKCYEVQEAVSAVSGAAFAMNKIIYQQLGGLDKDFFMYMEEIDLSVRARLAGYLCIFVPTSHVLHDYEFRVGPKKVFLQERNRYLFLAKNFHLGTLLILTPGLILAELITWAFTILRDRRNLANKWDAYRWIAKNWMVILDKRKCVQKARKTRDREIIKEMISDINFLQVSNNGFELIAGKLLNFVFYLLKQIDLLLIWW